MENADRHLGNEHHSVRPSKEKMNVNDDRPPQGRKVVLLGKPATDRIRTSEDKTRILLIYFRRGKIQAHVTGAVYSVSYRVSDDDGYR